MLTCILESGRKTSLRHVVLHAIVERKGELLLVKRAKNIIEGGKWALPGGFLDRDETASQGILRELKEETGWEGDVVTLFRINTKPNRPGEDRQNVAIDFIIKPMRQIGRPSDEVSQVAWVPFSKLPPLTSLAFDHGESLALFLKYRQAHFDLPWID